VTNLKPDCASRCMHFTMAISLQVNNNAYSCSKSIEFEYVRNISNVSFVKSSLLVGQFPIFKTLNL
jgi:hypothetical protein